MRKAFFSLVIAITALLLSFTYKDYPKTVMGNLKLQLASKPVQASTQVHKSQYSNIRHKLDVKQSIGRGEVIYIPVEGSKPQVDSGKQRTPSGSVGSNQTSDLPIPLLTNAKSNLLTPTYDGSGQAVHPSVIDFKIEYKKEKWMGYRYWMAFTPYPFAIDKYENPSLLASNDGINWVVPEGFKKPIDIKPGRSNYNSDPALVYDPISDSIVLYWRETVTGKCDRIWRTKISSTGKIEPKVQVIEELWTEKDGLALSPAVWRKTSEEWYMFTANGSSLVHLYTSRDGINWSARERTEMPWLEWNNGFIPWHLDVKPNYRENRLEFFIAGWPKGKGISDMILFYAESPLNEPKKLTMPLKEPILGIGVPKSWDNDFLYRPTFVIEKEEESYKYHLWYSARSTTGHWQIGYTEGKLGTSFSPDRD